MSSIVTTADGTPVLVPGLTPECLFAFVADMSFVGKVIKETEAQGRLIVSAFAQHVPLGVDEVLTHGQDGNERLCFQHSTPQRPAPVELYPNPPKAPAKAKKSLIEKP